VGSGTSSSKVFVHPDLVDSIPSQVTAMDSNGDLIVDRIYVGDTGGRIWRADISGSDTSAWTLTKLADVGRHYSSTTEDDRRFFHAPEIVQHIDSSGPFDAIVMGSGDRADPLGYRGYADNFVYMIKDANVKSGTGVNTSLDHGDFGDVTNTCLQVGAACTANLADGWKMGLTVDGEAALAKPIALGGVIFFTTYLPPGASAEESCGPDEGSGRFYAVDLDNAQAVRNYDATTEDLERFDDLDSDGIPSGAFFVPFSGAGDATGMVWKPDNRGEEVTFPTRMRTFWLESEDGTL
jgi:type IV pilus assembly protein PilY1